MIVSDPGRARREPRRNSFRPAGGSSPLVPSAAGTGAQRPRRAPQRLRRGPVAAAGRRPAPSRYYAKDVSALLPQGADTRSSRRHRRYALRGILWRESRIERVRKCGRVPAGSDGIAVIISGGVAHYRGLVTCGSVWGCTCCAPKILNIRAQEISTAVGEWVKNGGACYMVTLTMPHDAGMRLRKLLPVIANGWRAVLGGRPWTRLRRSLGIVGQIRSVEVTHGLNGWHPHLHVLLVANAEFDARGLVDLDAHITAKWNSFIIKAGYRPPSGEHGVKIVRCWSAAEAGLYIAKTDDGKSVGNEMARGDLKEGRKQHRTPFEILADFAATGDAEDLELWHEYELATRGHQRITWSKGLRQIMQAGPERTDEEIAAEEIGGDVTVMIPVALWRQITWIPGLPAAVLDAAESGGHDAIQHLVSRFGCG